jgi:YHS domain-containing protein
VQGPDTYLRDMGISLECAVYPERPAKIDADHRAFVNWEAYYFSDAQARAEFAAAPYRFATRLTDPVTHQRFVATDASPRRDYGERVYYFGSDQTAARFDADPDAYATPLPGMVEMR